MKVKTLLFAAIFLLFIQVFITFPIAAWARNKNNFDVGIYDVQFVLLIITFAIFSISAIISYLMPKKAALVILPFMIAVTLAVFIQQNFLNWNYGILDGLALDFASKSALGIIDIALWVSAIFAAVLFKKKIISQATNILLAVGLVVTAIAGLNWVNFGESSNPYTRTNINKFDFSSDKNVIVFLFDGYQLDVFQELLDKHPEFQDVFSDFTFYDNNSAVYAKTYPTIPLFLTGNRYQKEVPILDFFETTYDFSLLADMKKAGWDVGLYPRIDNVIPNKPEIMSNLVGGKTREDKIDSYLQTLDLSLFRAVPHHLKPNIYNDGDFVARKLMRAIGADSPKAEPEGREIRLESKRRTHHALIFDWQLEEFGAVKFDEPAFRFYHLMVPHQPFSLDSDLNYGKLERSFESYQQYSLAGLKLMRSYLDSLRELGVYDDASIIIVSDHGKAISNRVQYNVEMRAYEDVLEYPLQKAAAKSILLVKEAGVGGKLKRSNKPTSGVDIAPTLAALAGFETSDYEGTPVQDISPTDVRERIFNHYHFSSWDSKYLEDFETFKIVGHVKQRESWQETGILREAVKFENKSKYVLGQTLTYGTDIKADTDYSNAFIDLEGIKLASNHARSESGIINLSIPFKKRPKKDVTLELELEIDSKKAQSVVVTVNGDVITGIKTNDAKSWNETVIISPDQHKGSKEIKLTLKGSVKNEAADLNLSKIVISKSVD